MPGGKWKVSLLLAIAGVPAAAQSKPAQAEQTAAGMPDGAGKDIILRECTGCHMPDHFTQYRHTNEEWQSIVIRMGQRVKSATTQELETVQKYLAANFPKIEDNTRLNVNKATAREIAGGLGLTLEEAALIVDYRERHGSYREWGDMLVIYGLDGRKVEAVKDKMTF